MKRSLRTFTTCLVLAMAWGSSAGVLADAYSTGPGPNGIEPGNSELFEAMEARTQRDIDTDPQQPVDWTCGNGEGMETLPDGPASSSMLCDGSFIQLVETPLGNEIIVEKMSLTTGISTPGPVVYEYEVTSGASIPLTGINLMDDQVDSQPTCPQTQLLPGQQMFCNATYTVTPMDLANNGAPVPGSGFVQNNVVATTNEGINAMASLQIPIMLAPAGVNVMKSSPTVQVSMPGPVNYNYVVTNTGGVQLTGIELSDDHVDSDPTCPLLVLNPGEDMTCTAVYTVTATDIANMGSPTPGSGFLENEAL